MNEDDGAPRLNSFRFVRAMRGRCRRLLLPTEDLSIIRGVVCEIVKLRNLSHGNRQAHEEKQNGKDPTHGFSRIQPV